MAIPYYLIYHESDYAQGLEWATKYHVISDVASAGVAEALAEAEAILVHSSLEFTRWEWINADGHKVGNGGFSGIVGLRADEAMPIHYAVYLRLNVTAGVGRPSGRYIHGYPETFSDNGTPSSSFQGFRADYTDALNALPLGAEYTDSDGNPVSGHSFRGFSRRKRMRRKAL